MQEEGELLACGMWPSEAGIRRTGIARKRKRFDCEIGAYNFFANGGIYLFLVRERRGSLLAIGV